MSVFHGMKNRNLRDISRLAPHVPDHPDDPAGAKRITGKDFMYRVPQDAEDGISTACRLICRKDLIVVLPHPVGDRAPIALEKPAEIFQKFLLE